MRRITEARWRKGTHLKPQDYHPQPRDIIYSELLADHLSATTATHLRADRCSVFGVAFAGALILLASTDAALADLVWRNGRWVDERSLQANMDPQVQVALMRFLVIGVATGIGFAIGWFFSPQGRDARMAALTILGVIGFGAVAFNDGLFGWSVMMLLAVIGFFVGLGYWLGRSMQSLMETPTTFGSAQWADAAHLTEKGMFQSSKGLMLGAAFNGEAWDKIAYDGDRHLFTYAPTRSGKGVSHIVPNLLAYDGSVLVIDPKGENAIITANARAAMGQEILAIDPWGIAVDQIGIKAARFNPLDWIRLDDPDATENAMLLADALVQKSKKGDPFWQEEAKALLQGLILLVAFDETYEGRPNLGTVRDLLLLGEKEMTALFTYMADSMHPLIASTGSRCLQCLTSAPMGQFRPI
ncbi:MAG: type IV secretory system conjugative DNA transfer family protein [Cyanobacteria bacterium P01_A01_bin.17]